MSKITIRYDDNTGEILQTYQGINPNWPSREGQTITETNLSSEKRASKLKSARQNVSESDYDTNTETIRVYLTYDSDTDSVNADVEIQQLPETLQS